MGQSSSNLESKSPTRAATGCKIPVSHTPFNAGTGDSVKTRFEWRRGGQAVYLTGSFNKWKERIQMIFDGNVWFIEIPLPVGPHQYKFVVDNQWRYDKEKPTRTDPIGNVNNVLEVAMVEPDDSGPYTSDLPDPGRGIMIDPTRKPMPQPRQLMDSPLNAQMKDDGSIMADFNRVQSPSVGELSPPARGDQDPCLLPMPQHIVLTHVYSAHAAHSQQYGISVRYRNKFITTIVYYPSINTINERARLDDEGRDEGRVDKGLGTHSATYVAAMMAAKEAGAGSA